MRLSLRDPLESDLPTLYEHQCDPVACKMAAFAPRARDEFMEHWKKILDDPEITRKTLLIDGRVAGFFVSFERSGKQEIGYWIGREYWGRGVATEGLSRFLRCVTTRPLYAVVAAHNIASIRVLAKCGFVVDENEAPNPVEGEESVVETLLKLDAVEATC